MAETLFWIAVIIVGYTFGGYGLLLAIVVGLKRLFSFRKQNKKPTGELPEVCLFVTAYNEADFVAAKVENSFHLNYPKEKTTTTLDYGWLDRQNSRIIKTIFRCRSAASSGTTRKSTCDEPGA